LIDKVSHAKNFLKKIFQMAWYNSTWQRKPQVPI
jgi:hypothetical protein